MRHPCLGRTYGSFHLSPCLLLSRRGHKTELKRRKRKKTDKLGYDQKTKTGKLEEQNTETLTSAKLDGKTENAEWAWALGGRSVGVLTKFVLQCAMGPAATVRKDEDGKVSQEKTETK